MAEYDKFAKEYLQGTEELERKTRENFRSLLPDLAGKRLLDVGRGPGVDGIYYNEQGAEVYGIDISSKEIEMARDLRCGNFRVGDMNELPYSDNSFDIVTSFYAIQHVEDVKRPILEMIRVAKPGGPIAFVATHPFRQFIEGYIYDGDKDYYSKNLATCYIFNRKIKLIEPKHNVMDYLSPEVLDIANLERVIENTNFPASEQIIPGLIHPTDIMMKFRKK